MMLGLALSICNPQRSVSSFDPATLGLSGWWRASFAGSPWEGTSSAGASGSRDLSNAITAPAVGVAVNGYMPASYNGTDDFLAGAAGTLGDYLSSSAYTIIVLAKITGAAPAAGSVYTDEHIMGDEAGYYGVTAIDDSGTQKLRGYHDDGALRQTGLISFPEDTWGMIVQSYNGTTLSLDVNESGSPVTVAAGGINAAFATRTLRQGVNFNASVFCEMDILETITAQSALSALSRAGIKSYFNARYGLAL